MTGRRKKPRVGRRPVPIKKAREFGRQVEQEKAAHPDDKQTRIFERIRRRDPRRWKSPRTIYRLWAVYQKDTARRASRPGTRRERLIAKLESRRPSYRRKLIQQWVHNHYLARASCPNLWQ